MREEVRVGCRREDGQGSARRVVDVPEVEHAPGADEIAADGGVPKAGQEWDAGQAEDCGFGVDPGAGCGFEYLHGGADQMEEQDGAGFLPCF